MTTPRVTHLRAHTLTTVGPGAAHDYVLAPVPDPNAGLRKPVRLAIPPGRRKELRAVFRGLTVVFVVDDSGSMYGAHVDDAGVRYLAAQSVIDLMSRAGGGRAGVVHWGSTAPEHLALAPVSVTRERRALVAALTPPSPDLQGTNLLTGLDRAQQLLPAAGASQMSNQDTTALLVISDGLDALSPEVAARIRALPPADVHLLLIDHQHRCTPEVEQQWRALPLASFTRLSLQDPAEMTWQIGHALVHSLGLTLPPLKTRRFRR